MESDQVESFFSRQGGGGEENELGLKVAYYGSFSIESFYNVLEVRSVEPFPQRVVWHVGIHLRLAFLLEQHIGEGFDLK